MLVPTASGRGWWTLHRLVVVGAVSLAVVWFFWTVWENDAALQRLRAEGMGFARPEASFQQELSDLVAKIQEIEKEKEEQKSGTESSTQQNAASSETQSGSGGIRNDAHKIQHADDFLPHFHQVLQLAPSTFEACKKTCTWSGTEKTLFQFEGQSDGWGGVNLSWTKTPYSQAHIDAERTRWQDFVRTGMMPWREHAHRFAGKGIVIVGGGGKSMKRIVLILRRLALLGSELPVEVHYWKDEMTAEKMAILRRLWPRMRFNDLAGEHNVFQTSFVAFPGKSNYNLKTAALLNTPFAEALLLDSDNLPIAAPDPLFTSPSYQAHGTLFWPDISRTRPDNPIWAITNTPCRMDEYEQESGQLLVDKRRYWYHLQLAAWMNAPASDGRGGSIGESAYYSRILGDKDTFRFAWHALRTRFGAPRKAVTSVGSVGLASKASSFAGEEEGGGEMEGLYCGHSFLQYHPDDGTPLFMHGGTLKTMAPAVMRWQRERRGGIFQVYKKSPFEMMHEKTVDVRLGFDSLDWFPEKEKVEEGHATWCTFMDGVEARPLEELVPGFEAEFERIGGYWPLEEEEEEAQL